MVISISKVNWFNEGLNSFYGDDNNGYIHGIYVRDDCDEIIDVSWFKTENEQQKYMNEIGGM
jgi:hypothetical protein